MPVFVQVPDEGFSFAHESRAVPTTISPVTGSAAIEQQVDPLPAFTFRTAYAMLLTTPEEFILTLSVPAAEYEKAEFAVLHEVGVRGHRILRKSALPSLPTVRNKCVQELVPGLYDQPPQSPSMKIRRPSWKIFESTAALEIRRRNRRDRRPRRSPFC